MSLIPILRSPLAEEEDGEGDDADTASAATRTKDADKEGDEDGDATMATEGENDESADTGEFVYEDLARGLPQGYDAVTSFQVPKVKTTGERESIACCGWRL